MAGTGVGKYSTTAANNTSVQSTNWSEGMAPSDVNNAARETLANIRAAVNDIAAGYVELGDTDGEYTVTKIDADTFTINTANDLRVDYYQVGRKVKVTHSNGVTSGVIESTAYSSPTLTINLSGANITGAAITKVELGLPSAGGAANLDMDDNARLRFGDSQDLQIYHDSNNSYIEDSGTGSLVIETNDLAVKKQSSNETMITATEDLGVGLYYDNTKRLETTSSGATVTGDLAVSGSITAGGTNIIQNAYPVGSVYINATNATNPNTLLGFGTWVRFGEGRMLISEDGGNSRWNSAEETGGSETVTLTTAQMPGHSHFIMKEGSVTTNGVFGAVTNPTAFKGGAGGMGSSDYHIQFSTGNPDVGSTNTVGSDNSHDNMPPFITVYMLKRTA